MPPASRCVRSPRTQGAGRVSERGAAVNAARRTLRRRTHRWGEQPTKPRSLVGDLKAAPLDRDVWDAHTLRRTVAHTRREPASFAEVLTAPPGNAVGPRSVPPEEALFT